MVSLILKLCTRWRREISYTPHPPYPTINNTLWPIFQCCMKIQFAVKTNQLVLLREINGVCCGNCREQISVDCVAISCLVLKCWQLEGTDKC